jgi:hypothetical protein
LTPCARIAAVSCCLTISQDLAGGCHGAAGAGDKLDRTTIAAIAAGSSYCSNTLHAARATTSADATSSTLASGGSTLGQWCSI